MKNLPFHIVSIAVGVLFLAGCATQNPVSPGQQTAGDVSLNDLPSRSQQGVSMQSQEMKTVGALSYSTGDLHVDVTVHKNDPLQTWNAKDLKAGAEECGTKQDLKYYEGILAELKGKDMITFKFMAQNNPEESFEVTLLANAHKYMTLQDFRKDFGVCAAGGAYPSMVSPKWLLFTGSCGGAYDKTPPLTCNEISNVVVPSLKLNE